MKNIKDFCAKIGINENQFYGKETVGGSLYLSGLTSIPQGFKKSNAYGYDKFKSLITF